MNLPKTGFPMRASLPQREPALYQAWEKADIYARLRETQKDRPRFILHDGPPFANGDAHMGHALNMTLKDIVLKSKNMGGFDVPFIPGWDCHGLPIEHKVMKELADGGRQLDPLEIREKCEAMARKYIDIQRQQFKRLGVFGEWDNPYITMDGPYEADVLRLFAKIVDKGMVYQALRPVYWSTGCQTALAEAEVEYQPKTDLSVYVKFPLTKESAAKLEVPPGTALLIWTTTPWTLPANLAVAVSEHLDYHAYGIGSETIICAQSLTPKIPNFGNAAPKKHFLGKTLAKDAEYQHPFLDRRGKVYVADFVTGETGTGLVHIAPGHGQDDYQLGQREGLAVLSPVDDRGCLTAEAGVPELTGQYVFKANPLVRDLLREKGALWTEESFTHDYPHCWRSKTPIVFRAVKQWFIRVDDFRQPALDAINNKVKWVPAWGKSRIANAVATRPDWCISRQRTWGVPIPVFYKADGSSVMEGDLIRKVADLVEKHGTNLWFEKSDKEICALLEIDPSLKKGRDTLDVWIDSGSSHEAVLRRRAGLGFPADLYLEGSDQHRGWFQSSLSTSVAVYGKPPYKEVLTNGFVVDLDGKKLSKSNTYQKPTDLMAFVDKFGADILRLWVASQDYRDDVPFSEEIFKIVTDTYRSFRNALRILLANLYDFDPAKDRVSDDKLSELDLYVLNRLEDVIRQARAAYETYEFHQVYHVVNRFCAVDLSAFYIDVTKDRMYCDAASSLRRRASQTVMYEMYEALVLLLAPIVPFTAEEAWQFFQDDRDGRKAEGALLRPSVHLSQFPKERELRLPGAEAFAARWEKILELRSRVNEHLEKARQAKEIGKSLEAQVVIGGSGLADSDRELLEEVLIVSKVKLEPGESLAISVRRDAGKKCVRCWKYFEHLGSHPEHPEICVRCTEAVTALR
ncbi:MAG: isoleucine--tRNA ligase [Methylacidiphilales bacterium]|nr:isoleucine--tRNA ligase [Candidatus Methylacidiphilales bacterium]